MDMTQIINQMIVLFLMMGTGYVCGKIGYMDSDFSKKLTNIILMVTTPAMILASVTVGEVSFSKTVAFEILAAACAVFVVLTPVACLICKLMRIPAKDFKLYVFMLIFSNTGFMGYPVVATIFGDDAIFLASIFNMIFSIMVYSLGVWLMDSRGGKFNVKTLLNPSMISSVLALVIFIFEIKIPSALAMTLDSIGSITSPSAMLLIGSSLSLMPIKEIVGEIKLYPFTVIKQIIIPFAMFYLFGMFIKDATLLGIMTILIAMPVASIAVMFANQYDGDAKLASKGVFITTMCSFVTIPLLCMFL